MSETNETRCLKLAGKDETASGASYQTFPLNDTEDKYDFGSTVQLQPVISSDNGDNYEVGERQIRPNTANTKITTGIILKMTAISLTFMSVAIADVTPGLCLVHLSLIFTVPISEFGILFSLKAIAGVTGSALSIFLHTQASYEVQLFTIVAFRSALFFLSPWFSFTAFCALQSAAELANGCCTATSFPYVIRIWNKDDHHQKKVSLQLLTLMHTTGLAIAPAIIDLFLTPLPDDVDERKCNDLAITNLRHNLWTNDTQVTPWITSVNDSTTLSLLWTQTTTANYSLRLLSNQTDVLSSVDHNIGLVRWAFSLSSSVDMVAAILFATVCVMFQQTYTSDSSSADDHAGKSEVESHNDSTKSVASFALVGTMFTSLFSWGSVLGTLVLYLQTFAIIGLGWHKSDASYLNAICAAGQVTGRVVVILLSAVVNQRLETTVVVLLMTGVGGLLLMTIADLWTIYDTIFLRFGVFIAGGAFSPILPLTFLLVEQNHSLDVFKSAILVAGMCIGFVFGSIVAGLLLCDYGSMSFLAVLFTFTATNSLSLAALVHIR